MTWIKIDRDKNGFATEECLESMRKAIPFVYVFPCEEKDVYVAVGDEQEFDMYKQSFYTDSFCVTHYLPIPKLEV